MVEQITQDFSDNYIHLYRSQGAKRIIKEVNGLREMIDKIAEYEEAFKKEESSENT